MVCGPHTDTLGLSYKVTANTVSKDAAAKRLTDRLLVYQQHITTSD